MLLNWPISFFLHCVEDKVLHLILFFFRLLGDDLNNIGSLAVLSYDLIFRGGFGK